MLALDCFWCKSVKGKAAKKGINTIFSYKIRSNLSFHIKFSYGVDFYHRQTAVGCEYAHDDFLSSILVELKFKINKFLSHGRGIATRGCVLRFGDTDCPRDMLVNDKRCCICVQVILIS